MDLAVITIGQAPRPDMIPEMSQWLTGVDITEYGALDGLTAEQIAAIAPTPDDEALTTRLSDGTNAVISHRGVDPLMQQRIREAEANGASTVLLVCTGHFPPMEHTVPLLKADHLLTHALAAVADGLPVGIIAPLDVQQESSREKFSVFNDVVATDVATPYQAEAATAIAEAAVRLAEQGARYLVLDCMGYTAEHRDAAARASGLPVLLARQAVADLAGLAAACAAAKENA